MALSALAKANLYKAGLGMIASGDALVTDNGDGTYKVTPNAAQNKAILSLVNSGMSFAAAPSDVSVDLSGIYKPILFTKVLPLIGAIGLAGFLLGKYLK